MARRPETAFTLVELLTVIGIVAILAALLLPVANNATLSGKQATSVQRIRSLQAANISYAAEHDDDYVPVSANGLKDTSGSVSQYPTPWFINYDFLMYFVDNPGIYWWGNPPKAFDSALYRRVKNNPGAPATSFGYNAENLPPSPNYWPPGKLRTVNVQNPSRVMAFAESQDDTLSMAQAGAYNAALPDQWRAGVIAYRYHDRANVVFFDGHVEQLKKEDVVNNTMLWKGQ